jgi:hypothetical protein
MGSLGMHRCKYSEEYALEYKQMVDCNVPAAAHAVLSDDDVVLRHVLASHIRRL